jgi:hypothetical protein
VERAPQLAVLAALDAAADGAFTMLLIAHQEMCDWERAREWNAHAAAARPLALRLMELKRLLESYVAALEEPAEPPDEGPLDGPILDVDF